MLFRYDYFSIVFEDELIDEIIEVGTYKKIKEKLGDRS